MKPRYLYPIALAVAFLVLAGAAFFSTSGSLSVSSPTSTITTTAAATSTTGGPSMYTMAQIAEHNSAASCYTAINGKVYDLTSFIPEHPGGDRILTVCGVDGTQAFEAQHGGSSQANAILAQLQIGVLAP